MIQQVWIEEPSVIFNNRYISEIWPTESMNYERKVNAITRMIIVTTMVGYILTLSTRIIIVGVISIFILFLSILYKKKYNNHLRLEPFETNTNQHNTPNKSELKKLTTHFSKSTENNPFSNVLLTDITDNSNKKAANPSYIKEINNDITDNIKKTVQKLNPDIKDTNSSLFGDLWNKFQLDRSNHSFYSTANTKVVNDQGSFAQYLYGNMPSSKEQNSDGAFAREQNTQRYNLY